MLNSQKGRVVRITLRTHSKKFGLSGFSRGANLGVVPSVFSSWTANSSRIRSKKCAFEGVQFGPNSRLAWLLFFLVATVGGGLVGMIIGGFVAAFLGAGGMSLPQMTRILQIVGFVIAIPISYITFRAVVGRYLLPKIEDDDDVPPKT